MDASFFREVDGVVDSKAVDRNRRRRFEYLLEQQLGPVWSNEQGVQFVEYMIMQRILRRLRNWASAAYPLLRLATGEHSWQNLGNLQFHISI